MPLLGQAPRLATAVACSILAGAATAAISRTPPMRFTFTAPHMGTDVRIVLYAGDEKRARAAADAAFARIAVLDQVLSDYRHDSELMRLCRHASGESVSVSDDLFRVLSHAQRIAHASRGAFDPTVGRLTKLWRRARRTSEWPTPGEVDTARKAVGYDALTLDPVSRTARLERDGMCLDLGGIGKGFAADEAAMVLRRHAIQHALIAAGGDIAAIGGMPKGDDWTVAVASLDAVEGQPHRIQLRDAAISTSGDREQWMTHRGIRYSHIIDPRTGWPVAGSESVTVVARTATDSDALATAIAVLGAEKGLRLIAATAGAAVFIQRAKGTELETFASPGWVGLQAIVKCGTAC